MRIPGYSAIEELHRGRTRAVYRGRRDRDGKSVVLKTLHSKHSSPSAVAQLRREYQVLNGLAVDGVPRPLSLEEHSDGPMLILEDRGGVPLSQIISEGRLDVVTAVRVAIGIARIIGEIHRNEIIHRDVNPNNVLVDPKSLRVSVIDFDIATPLPTQHSHPASPSVLEGTIAYMSPEQTGRMNREVDYRTDLYSLGVTLYELLTGRLPFFSADPLEVVHGHIAMTATPPAEVAPGVPEPLSGITMKLLTKTAEERYQSADGLVADLTRCLKDLESVGAIREFDLGRDDISDRFVIPQRLYGRGRELDELLSAFDAACRGGVELMMVAGYSGIGKSSLIHELHRSLSGKRGHFATGKFDQVVRNIPYGAVAQALGGLMRQILSEPEEVLASWREAFLEALGPNVRVVIDLVPELERIVGEHPALPTAGAAETQNRFDRAFQKFLGVLAGGAHPLVLFLDDLQWADSGTLRLIQTILADPKLSSLLIIGAFRDNEVSETHPLVRTLAEIERSGRAIRRMELGPLAIEDLTEFVADALRQDMVSVRPLSYLLLRKTNGNPFFVTQFLKSLHREQLLALNRSTGSWEYELESIAALGITDNVVDLMARKIRGLTEPVQHVLELAACIGSRFDLATLAAVNDKSPRDTSGEVWEAIVEGLILPQEAAAADAFRTASEGVIEPRRIRYRFLHDRVQQAAYALIPDSQKRQLHLTVGRLMLTHWDELEQQERIFELVDQLNHGVTLISDPEERLRLAELNLVAGRRAKTTTAHQTALGYLRVATSLLSEDRWSRHYNLSFPLHLELAECEYLAGDFRAAETTFELLTRVARTPLDEAEVHILRTVLCENMARYREATESAQAGLALFGIRVPARTEMARALEKEIDEIESRLSDRAIADLIELSPMTDPQVKTCMRLLAAAWAPAYIAGDADLIAWIPAKMVNLSLAYGNTAESACGYVVHGITLGTRFDDYAAGYEFGRLALRLNDDLADVGSRAKVHHLFSCFVNLWRQPLRSCFEYSREAYRSGLQFGDFVYATYASFHESWYGLLVGRDLPTFQEEYAANVTFLEQIQNHAFADAQQVILNWGRAFQGLTRSPDSLDDDDFSEARYLATYRESPFFQVFYYVTKAHLLLTSGRHAEAQRAAEQAQPVINSLIGTIWPMLHCFYHAMSIAASLPATLEDEATRDLARVTAAGLRLQRWAENCPRNFRHAHLLVSAELARIEGRHADAVDLYEEAIRRAVESELWCDEALANERCGSFWLFRGQEGVASVYLSAAARAYDRRGATAKARSLRDRYPGLAEPARGAAAAVPLPTLTTTRTAASALDLVAVMKAARVIAGEIDLQGLLSKLLRILIENAGAERGALCLVKSDELLLEAEGDVRGGSTRVLGSLPLQDSERLPLSILNYVRRTAEGVVLANAQEDETYRSDPYILSQRPKSVLCTPVVHQGVTTGVVYLENNLAADAFREDHLKLVQLLSAHAAIALRNAELFAEVVELRDRLEAENVYLQEEIKTRHGFEEIIGESLALRRVLHQIQQVAPTDTTVLITGETGTGKELVARAIHNLSRRRERSLVTVNCGAISPGVVESELFGHEKGAFTGAVSRKIGRFELADGGTIFLDEIGDLPPDLQVKLLRVLQEGEIERVGGTGPIKVDVRVIAATHHDLQAAAGRFRSDLFYRLAVFPIYIPPLRERSEDIPQLVRYLVVRFGEKMGRRIETIPKNALESLTAYSWPGNVRELRNVLERSVITSRGTTLELAGFSPAAAAPRGGNEARTLEEMERDHILRVLELTGWRVSGPDGAAHILGKRPTTLESRMKKLGIVRPGRSVPDIS